MPYIDLYLQPAPTPAQAAILASGITDAMQTIMGKRREVTAVRIVHSESVLWTINALPPEQTTAYLEVKITAGTNSGDQKAALIAHLEQLLRTTLGKMAEASYIVIHELTAENWGYAGLTQAQRHAMAV